MKMIRIPERRVRMNPFAELERLLSREVSEWPFGLLGGVEGRARTMPLDIYETATSRLVQVELPGVTRDDVKLEFERSALKIRVKRVEGEGESRSESEMSRTVQVGDDIDPESIKAKLENGLLTVTLQKREQARAQTIAIE